MSGVGKIVDFRLLSRRISETVQDKVQVAVECANRNMYTRFRLVLKSMTSERDSRSLIP